MYIRYPAGHACMHVAQQRAHHVLKPHPLMSLVNLGQVPS